MRSSCDWNWTTPATPPRSNPPDMFLAASVKEMAGSRPHSPTNGVPKGSRNPQDERGGTRSRRPSGSPRSGPRHQTRKIGPRRRKRYRENSPSFGSRRHEADRGAEERRRKRTGSPSRETSEHH